MFSDFGKALYKIWLLLLLLLLLLLKGWQHSCLVCITADGIHFNMHTAWKGNICPTNSMPCWNYTWCELVFVWIIHQFILFYKSRLYFGLGSSKHSKDIMYGHPCNNHCFEETQLPKFSCYRSIILSHKLHSLFFCKIWALLPTNTNNKLSDSQHLYL